MSKRFVALLYRIDDILTHPLSHSHLHTIYCKPARKRHIQGEPEDPGPSTSQNRTKEETVPSFPPRRDVPKCCPPPPAVRKLRALLCLATGFGFVLGEPGRRVEVPAELARSASHEEGFTFTVQMAKLVSWRSQGFVRFCNLGFVCFGW